HQVGEVAQAAPSDCFWISRASIRATAVTSASLLMTTDWMVIEMPPAPAFLPLKGTIISGPASPTSASVGRVTMPPSANFGIAVDGVLLPPCTAPAGRSRLYW